MPKEVPQSTLELAKSQSLDNCGTCLQSQSKFLLTTTFPNRHSNIDIDTGEWRPLNLNITPFDFPEPRLVINENCTEKNNAYKDKSLALYLIDEIDLPDDPYE